MNLGKFITIEGTEGAGKSTILGHIQTYFIKAKKDLLLTREPGGTPFAEAIRKLILYPENNEIVQPETELLLMFAARIQHLQMKILPALNAGKWVLSDRYVDASYAYQGGGRRIPLSQIKSLDRLFVQNHYPDLTLLLDVPANIGYERAEKRGVAKDRTEQEQMDFFVRVREAYLERALEDPDRVKIVDANQPLDKVSAEVNHFLDAFLKMSK